MSNIEILGLVVSLIGVGCFAAVFTILYITYSKATINEFKSGKKDIELIDEAIYDNLSNVQKRRKIMRTIKSIGFYGLMIIIIPFFVLSLVNKFTGNVTMVANKGIIVVATGSMSEKNEKNEYLITNNLDNQFDAYSIIVIEKVKYNADLQLYDVISFTNDKGDNIIHRIIGIGYGPNGVEYETRGDSNNISDTYRPNIKDIHGKYTGQKLPLAGMFVLFMQSSIGLVTIVALVYCLTMIDKITNKIMDAQDKRLERLSQAIDFENETELGKMKSNFIELIYYKGCCYKFNEEGFIEKVEIEDEEYLKKSNDSIIKVIEDQNNNEVISKEIKLDDNEEGKEG